MLFPSEDYGLSLFSAHEIGEGRDTPILTPIPTLGVKYDPGLDHLVYLIPLATVINSRSTRKSQLWKLTVPRAPYIQTVYLRGELI
jgi:hypothetical protein